MLLNRMVNAESFKNATGNINNPKRMADYDFANRFLAFYLKREQYKGELDPFMADALEQVNKMQGNEIDEILSVVVPVHIPVQASPQFLRQLRNSPGGIGRIHRRVRSAHGHLFLRLNIIFFLSILFFDLNLLCLLIPLI